MPISRIRSILPPRKQSGPGLPGGDEDLRGNVDGYRDGGVSGWAWRPSSPDLAIPVVVRANGIVLGEAIADLFRDDLASAGIGDGRHSFFIPLSISIEDGQTLELEVAEKDGDVLPGGRLIFAHPPRTNDNVHGNVDGYRDGGVSGWAWRPSTPDMAIRVVAQSNGVVLGEADADLPRDDLVKAGVGDGRHSFFIPLDVTVEEEQTLELQVSEKGGDILPGGRLIFAPPPPVSTKARVHASVPVVAAADTDGIVGDANETDLKVVGFVDGFRDNAVCGWAWMPNAPHMSVTVVVEADGIVLAETVADEDRFDLLEAGIGHGRYSFVIPLEASIFDGPPKQLSVSAKDGGLLQGGLINVGQGVATLVDHSTSDEGRAFIDAVLFHRSAIAPPSSPARRQHFILYCAQEENTLTDSLGMPEYSYYFVLRAFAPMLEKYGAVHIVHDIREIDRRFAACEAADEDCICLSFSPPHKTPLSLKCPTLPVIAWEFDTIPDRAWNGDRRHDWRFVLQRLGRAILHSEHTATAVRGAMGATFPVIAIPAPIWSRMSQSSSWTTTDILRERPDAEIYDSKAGAFGPGSDGRPSGADRETLDLLFNEEKPSPAADASGSTVEALEGIVFTSVLSPREARKNWRDLAGGFIAAFRDEEHATLLLKMISSDRNDWYWKLSDLVTRWSPMKCRIIAIHGYLADRDYAKLIDRSDWAVNLSSSEGQCLPLLEFMSRGVPALAPFHTALEDYIDPSNALIVESELEYAAWPHDPELRFLATRHRLKWRSIVEQYRAAHALARGDEYQAMAAAAEQRMATFCSDEAVGVKLLQFLGNASLLKPGTQSVRS